jgi:hypothetical protein
MDVDEGENGLTFPPEYLNSINIPGLPPHKLEFKVALR